MTTKQGSISLLQDPVAQGLLKSKIPARLAYVWPDGTPRVVPVWFHWNGSAFILGTLPGAPKLKALTQNAKVALTIDTEPFPAKVLMVRGTAQVAMVDELPEYVEMAVHYMGEEGATAFLNQVGSLFSQLGRIEVKPEWVGIIDFEKRYPSAIESAMESVAA